MNSKYPPVSGTHILWRLGSALRSSIFDEEFYYITTFGISDEVTNSKVRNLSSPDFRENATINTLHEKANISR